MDIYSIHPITIQALDSRAELLVGHFKQEIESAEPAYFAPFLRNQVRRQILDEWVCELASWEWALHHAQEVGAIKTPPPEGHLALSESLSLVLLKWDVLGWIQSKIKPNRKEQLLKIWFDQQNKKPKSEEITLEEAYVLDSLREGPLTVEDLYVQISSRGLHSDILHSMTERGILKFVSTI